MGNKVLKKRNKELKKRALNIEVDPMKVIRREGDIVKILKYPNRRDFRKYVEETAIKAFNIEKKYIDDEIEFNKTLKEVKNIMTPYKINPLSFQIGSETIIDGFELFFKGDNMDLINYLQYFKDEGIEFTIKEKKKHMLQLINGLKNIHDKGILHLDVKPANIIYNTNNSELEFIDFGNSHTFVDYNNFKKYYNLCTPSFASPESLRNDKCCIRSEIYSLGMVFYFIFYQTYFVDNMDRGVYSTNNDIDTFIMEKKGIIEAKKFKNIIKHPQLKNESFDKLFDEMTQYEKEKRKINYDEIITSINKIN